MFAPAQISSRVVRVPKTASQCSLKTSSLWMSSGRNVPSGSASTIRSPSASTQPPPAGVPVALLRLEHLASLGPLDLLGGALLSVVVDDQHLVDDAGRVEALDHRADRVALGVGHQDHGDSLVPPHQARPSGIEAL